MLRHCAVLIRLARAGSPSRAQRDLLPLTCMLRLLQDPCPGLSRSLTDTADVAADIVGAVLSVRLLFRWD